MMHFFISTLWSMLCWPIKNNRWRLLNFKLLLISNCSEVTKVYEHKTDYLPQGLELITVCGSSSALFYIGYISHSLWTLLRMKYTQKYNVALQVQQPQLLYVWYSSNITLEVLCLHHNHHDNHDHNHPCSYYCCNYHRFSCFHYSCHCPYYSPYYTDVVSSAHQYSIECEDHMKLVQQIADDILSYPR